MDKWSSNQFSIFCEEKSIMHLEEFIKNIPKLFEIFFYDKIGKCMYIVDNEISINYSCDHIIELKNY